MKLTSSAALSALVIAFAAPAWGDANTADPSGVGVPLVAPAPLLAGPGSLVMPWKVVPSSTTEQFAGQTDQQALDTASRENPELFASQPTQELDPPSGSKVEKYLDDYSARIDVAGQQADVIATSTTPIRVERDGVEQPVDLKLVDAGNAVEPRTPVVPLSFSDSLAGGMTIGHNIRIRVVGADTAANAQVDRQQVFYANALTDSDVLATPTPAGVETFVQLRSAQSPHTIQYQFDLPDGASLVQEAGDNAAVDIVRGDSVLATVTAPMSTDANDALVPTTMRVEGTRLILDVSVSPTTAFPVLVDPDVIDNQFANGDAASSYGSFQNTLGWRRETSGPLADFTFSPNGDNPSTGGPCTRVINHTPTNPGSLETLQQQLCVVTQSSRSYSGEIGQWDWRPPAGTRSFLNDGANIDTDAYVYRAQVRHSYNRLSSSPGAYMYAGIRSGRTNAWIGRNNDVDQYGNASDYRDGAWSFGQNTNQPIYNASFFRNYCAASDCSIAHPNEPNYDAASFAFGIYAVGSGHVLSANAQGAIFYQYDRTPPTAQQTGVSDLTAWKSTGTVTTQVSGTDAGMGMKSVGITYTDKNGTQTSAGYSYPCTGGILHTCPRTLSQQFAINVDTLPEGTDQLNSSTFDILGKQTNGPSVAVKVDRSAPTATIGGALVRTPAPIVGGQGPLTYTVGGTDLGSVSKAGLANVRLQDGGVDLPGAQTTVACGSPRQCPASLSDPTSLTFDASALSEGKHLITAVSTDDAGNRGASTPATIYVDKTAPSSPGNLDASFDASSGVTTVTWDAPDDPQLADGSAPAGTDSYSLRYLQPDGTWTNWAATQPPWLDVPNLPVGATVTVQVRALDAVGNTSATTSAALTVGDNVVTQDSMEASTPTPGETAVAIDPNPVAADDPADGASAASAYSETPCGSIGVCGTYNGRAAAAYALRWSGSSYQTDADRKVHSNPVYDYFGGRGGDCTNFVSQALVAGGMRYERSTGEQSPSPTDTSDFRHGPGSFWSYFTDSPIISEGSPRQYQSTQSFTFALQSYSRLLSYAGAQVIARNQPMKVGDIIFYNLAGTSINGLDHSQIVTRVTHNHASVTQHSPGFTRDWRVEKQHLDQQ